MNEKIIFHLAEPKEWIEQQNTGIYFPAAYEKEGFIHCCKSYQIKGVIERYYMNKEELVLLQIDKSLLKSKVIEEKASNNEFYPHIYGPINLNAVVGINMVNPKEFV